MASLPLWHPVGNHFSFLWLSSSSSLLLLSAQLEALPRHFVPYLQSRYSSDKRKQEELAVTREHLRRLHDVVDVVLPNLFTANYFRKFHHPDFYDKANVLLEYRGFGRDIKARGFHWLVLHKYFIRKYHVISFAWCKVSIISVKEIVQERLLDVTIRRHTLKKKIPSTSGSSGETNEAECMQKARWDEYRFVFHITRSGLVDHVKITQLNPPDRNQQWLKMPSLLERLLQRRAQAVP